MRKLLLAALAVVALPGVAQAEQWVMPTWGVESVQAHDPTLIPEVWAVDTAGLDGPWRMFKSFHVFSHTKLPVGTGVVYDNEPYGNTPRRELRHPRAYMKAFVQLAHERGLVAMLAPARTIAKYDRTCDVLAFTRCGYSRVRADYFLLQSQRLECDLARFGQFVQHATTAARSTLIVELTVAWADECVTVEQVLAAYDVGRGFTDHIALWSGPGEQFRAWDVQQAMLVDILRSIYPAEGGTE